MDKLVLELLISDESTGIYRSTGMRIFDQKSLDTIWLVIRAKVFGLISKKQFHVRPIISSGSFPKRPRDPLIFRNGVPVGHADFEDLLFSYFDLIPGDGMVQPLCEKVIPIHKAMAVLSNPDTRFSGRWEIREEIARLFRETH